MAYPVIFRPSAFSSSYSFTSTPKTFLFVFLLLLFLSFDCLSCFPGASPFYYSTGYSLSLSLLVPSPLRLKTPFHLSSFSLFCSLDVSFTSAALRPSTTAPVILCPSHFLFLHRCALKLPPICLPSLNASFTSPALHPSHGNTLLRASTKAPVLIPCHPLPGVSHHRGAACTGRGEAAGQGLSHS